MTETKIVPTSSKAKILPLTQAERDYLAKLPDPAWAKNPTLLQYLWDFVCEVAKPALIFIGIATTIILLATNAPLLGIAIAAILTAILWLSPFIKA